MVDPTRLFLPLKVTAAGGTGQAASSSPFNIYNRRYNYAPSDFDRTHALQSYWLYELPFGKGKKFGGSVGRGTNMIIGGWQLFGEKIDVWRILGSVAVMMGVILISRSGK